MSSRAAEVTFLKRSSSSVIVVSLCPWRREGGKEDVTHPYMVHLTAAKKTLLVQLTSVTVNGVSATVVRGVGTDACRHKTKAR